MGAFDDLIPAKGKKSGAQAKVTGVFADLVPSRADFSGVDVAVDTTESPYTGGYNGPVLAPSSTRGFNAPSLEEVNAKNRAYMASPQAAQDRAAAEQWQTQQRKQRFQDLPAPA